MHQELLNQLRKLVRQLDWDDQKEPIKKAIDTIEQLQARVTELEAERESIKDALTEDYFCVSLPIGHSVSELVSGYKDRNSTAAMYMQQLNKAEKQLAAQALTIKQMREVIRGMSFGADWNHGTHAKIYRNKLLSFLALPDNSTEVLQQWLDSVMGEPVVYCYGEVGDDVTFGHPQGYYPPNAAPLFRKPEIK